MSEGADGKDRVISKIFLKQQIVSKKVGVGKFTKIRYNKSELNLVY